ncbi:MAG TPA: DNA starvation/stationary phase protection protein [Acidimicrobiales bacterium]
MRTVPVADRLSAASALQALLPELVALSLQAKQAHWNVTGPGFLPIHELTDRIAADARAWADRVAERAVAVGFSVDGRPGTVSTATGPFPAGWVRDHEVVSELSKLIEGVAMRARSSLAELDRADPVAASLVLEVLEGLEKHHWMLEAQTL